MPDMFRTIFFSRIASAIATWLAIFTALFGLLVWATPDWFGLLRWSQIALLGFAFALATVLVVGCAVASFAYALRKIRPLPAGADGHALYEELQLTQERLKRAEERLDGARVVSAVGRASASDKPSNQTVSLPLLDNRVSGKRRLTDADRERCSLTLQEVHDFIGSELMPFLSELQRANAKSPHDFILAAAAT
jgi:hypothetical protein